MTTQNLLQSGVQKMGCRVVGRCGCPRMLIHTNRDTLTHIEMSLREHTFVRNYLMGKIMGTGNFEHNTFTLNTSHIANLTTTFCVHGGRIKHHGRLLPAFE